MVPPGLRPREVRTGTGRRPPRRQHLGSDHHERQSLVGDGAEPGKAEKASEEVAGYEARLFGVEGCLSTLTRMAGANITLALPLLGSAFALWATLSAIAGQPARIAR